MKNNLTNKICKEKSIYVNLTYAQNTTFGDDLAKMYYRTQLTELLDDYSGYPSNGGENSFSFNSSTSDALSFLELFSEIFGKSIEIFLVEEEIKTGSACVILRNLT